MTLPTPRQHEIIDRTLELVRSGGFAGVTMKRIADLVGVTDAALYRHFPTKQALLLAVLDRIEEMLLGPARQLVGERERPAAARLEALLAHHVEVLLATDSAPILMLAEASASGDEAVILRIAGIMSRYLELLEELCRQLDLPPTSPPPRDLALLLMGIPAAAGLRHRLLPDPALERRVAGELIPFLVRCLGGGS